jgi:hypothetical protein
MSGRIGMQVDWNTSYRRNGNNKLGHQAFEHQMYSLRRKHTPYYSMEDYPPNPQKSHVTRSGADSLGHFRRSLPLWEGRPPVPSDESFGPVTRRKMGRRDLKKISPAFDRSG